MVTAEYPDTKWGGPPRAYGTGRDGKAVRLSVIHYTAGSENRTSAESGAAYDKTRTDGTSCHVFHDPDSSVQEVLRKDRSNSAFAKGNRLGIQHELCGTAQTRAQWLDEASDAILWRAARAVAKDCVDFGLEPRRLSSSEVRRSWYEYPNGPRGICGHVDITNAFPEDGGTHTDPGVGFPWDIFIARVNDLLVGGGTDMNSAEWRATDHAWALSLRNDAMRTGDAVLPKDAGGGRHWMVDALAAVRTDIEELKNRPAVQPTPIDVETLKAALRSPEVQAVLIEAVRQGANAAEDS